MPLHPVYAQISALLAAVFILIAGNGLSNTLIPLSATAAAFPPLSIGLIGSFYFIGMFVGCLAAPRIIARAGHIRAFAAFVAIATVTTLAHPMFVDPAAWAAIRADRLLLCGTLRHHRKLDARQGRERGAWPRARIVPDRPLCRQRD